MNITWLPEHLCTSLISYHQWYKYGGPANMLVGNDTTAILCKVLKLSVAIWLSRQV